MKCPKSLFTLLTAAGLASLGSVAAQSQAATPILQPFSVQPAPAKRGWTACAPHERGQLTYTAGQRRITVPQEYSTWLREFARAEGVPEALLFSLVWHESGFCQSAVSAAGAVGLGQLMPATARGLGVNPHDARQNLWGTARYLRQQYQRFGRIELALAAYNAGPGRVAACGCVPPITETRKYVANIVQMYRSFG